MCHLAMCDRSERRYVKKDASMHAAQGNLPKLSYQNSYSAKHSYPEARCGLNFTTPFELLVATILSPNVQTYG